VSTSRRASATSSRSTSSIARPNAIAVSPRVAFPTAAASATAVRVALADAAAGRTSYRAALLVACAREAGCRVIPTDDMTDGANLGGVLVHNPFSAPAGLGEVARQLLALW
jgi:predicted nucleic acid-binding protein